MTVNPLLIASLQTDSFFSGKNVYEEKCANRFWNTFLSSTGQLHYKLTKAFSYKEKEWYLQLVYIKRTMKGDNNRYTINQEDNSQQL